MELLEFGHGGATVLIFPTSFGTFHEWEDRGMMNAIGHGLQNGWFHVLCVSSVDDEAWYCKWKHPGARAWRQHEYEEYLRNEVLPFAKWRNPHPYTITCGASFGAYHALDFGLRNPDRVNRILALSGLCDIRRFADGFYNDTVYFHNPIDFIGGEYDDRRLHYLRQQDIILAVGKDDGLIHQNRELSGKLWGKGIGNALREWDGFAHDWPVWERQLQMYLGGHD
jgi:esterase/lipase superfamily enzyme